MRIFRILLTLVVAGATFYGLNALAVQNGYQDRLDFRNGHFSGQHCNKLNHN